MHNRPVIVASILLTTALSITACGGDGPGQPTAAPRTPIANVDAGPNQLIFRCTITPGATQYKLLENADGDSGFTQTGADMSARVLVPIARDVIAGRKLNHCPSSADPGPLKS